jgi:hypothetical protein
MNFFFHYSSFSIDQMINNLIKYQLSKSHVKHKLPVTFNFATLSTRKYIIYTSEGVEYDRKNDIY